MSVFINCCKKPSLTAVTNHLFAISFIFNVSCLSQTICFKYLSCAKLHMLNVAVNIYFLICPTALGVVTDQKIWPRKVTHTDT
jgi:hypothetical protein